MEDMRVIIEQIKYFNENNNLKINYQNVVERLNGSMNKDQIII